MQGDRKVRVGIVDDHPLFLELLVTGLSARPEISVIWNAASVEQARRLFKENPVDVVVLDVELPDGNGVGLGLSLCRENAQLGVVLLSNLDLYQTIVSPDSDLRQGWSYLSKKTTASLATVVEVIKLSAQGQGVVDPAVLSRSPQSGSALEKRLTKRQLQILGLVAKGQSNLEIANQLGIAENSVINHLSSIYATLEIPEAANSRVAAVLRYLSEDT